MGPTLPIHNRGTQGRPLFLPTSEEKSIVRKAFPNKRALTFLVDPGFPAAAIHLPSQMLAQGEALLFSSYSSV